MAGFAEPWSWTQQRRQDASSVFPVLNDTSPDDALGVDAFRSSNGLPPSAFSQSAMSLAVHATAPEPEPFNPDAPDAAPNVEGWTPRQQPQTWGEPTYDPSAPDPLLQRTPGLTPLETYQRAQQGSMGFFTGNNLLDSISRAGRGLEGEQFSPYDLGFVRNMQEGDPLREPLARIESQLVDPINLATMGQAGAAKSIAVGIGAEEGVRALARGFGASPDTEATLGAIANIGGNIAGPAVVDRLAPRAATWMSAADEALAKATGAVDDAIRAQAPEAFQAGRVPGTDELFTFGPNGESVGPTGAVREIRLGREPVMGENVNRGLRYTNLGRAEMDQLAAADQAAFQSAYERSIAGAERGIGGGADLTPADFARLTAKKAAGEALTPEEQDSVLQALGKAMGATTADEQAAAREALYNGPVPTDMREVDTGLIEGVRRRLGAPTGSTVEDALRAAREGEPRIGGGAAQSGVNAPMVGAKPTAQTYTSPPTLRRLFGTREIVPGEQRGALERVAEEGRFRADDPIVTPALRVRAEARRAVENQATRVTAQSRTALARAFQTDADGRIAALAGIDPEVPGAPTIRDVAARLPRYEASLTAEQRQALQQVRDLVAPYRQALDEVAQAESAITGKPSSIKFGSRADVLDGGFYIPRGTAETEELADIAARRVSRGGGRVGGKQGFEKSATFGSEAEGIEAGYRYTPIDESLASYVRGAGNRALDRHTANYFLTRVDESGQRLAQSRADRAIEANPGLVNEMRGLRQIVQGLRGQAARLATKERAAVDAFLAGGSNDIEALSDALGQIAVTRGRNAGKVRADVLDAIEAAQQRIRDIRPAYREVIANAAPTPRDRGSIPLAGLDAYAFPYEMADEAARELQKETRNPGTVDAALRAVNGVFRGIQATGEMSYLGIQNAIGTVADPMAGARAAKASTKAWLNAGDEVLGDFISRFDARTAQKGLPTSEQWAAAGLRLGGAGTEFRVGGRKLPERVANAFESRPVQIATAPFRSLVKRADRGFGVAGDTMRLELADTLAEEAKLAGRALDDKTMRNIAESANRVTGWTPQRAFGDWGEAVNFAPRYLAARARALGQLASRDPQKRQLARRLVGRYLAIGTAMTVAINELNGEETDYRPFSGKQGPTFDPRKAEYKNPNFMRVMNVAGRDWSLLGGMDALLGTVVGAGSLVTNPTGDPKEMLERVRSIFTAPTASAGLDWMVFGEDFDGNKLTLDSEAGVRDLLGRVLPFATGDLGGSAMEVGRQAQEGDIGGAAVETAGGLAQGFIGGRGSRQTPREQVERGRYSEMPADQQFKAIPAQSWRLVRESGQDIGGYQTFNQWRTAKVGEISEYLRSTGVSNAEAKLQAETLVERMPAAQLYSKLKNAYETMWIAQNAESAGERLDAEVEKPGMERMFTPNQPERRIIEAAR